MAGQPITLTLPTVGDPFITAAPQVTTALTALEVELERKVTPADMSMSADLSFLVSGTYSRVTNLLASSYKLNAAALSAVTYPRSLYFTGVDGDLYVNDGAGRAVQVTASGALNVASTGAISSTGAPAYGSSGVTLRWDGADLEYEMRAGAGADDYADARLDDVLFNDGSGNFIRMGSPALAADYTLNLPNAVSPTNGIIAASTAGAVTTLAFTNTPTVTSLTTTGAATIGGAATVGTTLGVTGLSTLASLSVTGAAVVGTNITVSGTSTVAAVTASGLITANAGLTAGNNQDVTVSGTGQYKHGSKQRVIPAAAYVNLSGTLVIDALANWGGSATAYVDIPLPMEVGERIISVAVGVNDASGGSLTVTLYSHNISTGAIASVVSDTSTGTGWQLVTLSSADGAGMPATVASSVAYFVRVLTADSGDRIGASILTYDR